MGSHQTTSRQGILTDEQQELLSTLSTTILGQVGEGVQPYRGNLVPGENDLLRQGFETASSGVEESGAAARDSYLSLISGDPAFEVDPAARERVYEADRARVFQDADDLADQFEGRYAARGLSRSGGLEQSYGRALERATVGLDATRAGLHYADEEARRGSLEAGRDRMIPGLAARTATIAGDTGTLIGAGGEQRAILGQQQQAEYSRWLTQQPYANPWLGYLPQSLGTPAYQLGTTRTGVLG